MNPLFDDPDPRHALLSYDAELRGRGRNPLLAFGRNMGRAVRGMLGAGGDLNPTGGLIDPSVEGIVGAGDFAAEMLNPLPPLDRSIEAFGRGDYADAALEGYTAIPMGGIFAGVGAKTANRAALMKAQDMADAGMDRRAIWDETGWFKGRDGRWRFEIDDSRATVEAERLMPRSDEILRTRLDHPDLYRGYPDAGGIAFNEGAAMAAEGSYRRPIGRSGEQISIKPFMDDAQRRSTTLHEAQHAIQQREGFAGGTQPNAPNIGLSRSSIMRNAREAFDRIGPDDALRREVGDSVRWNDLTENQQASWYHRRLYDDYARAAGEVEARNVQTRMDMTPAERRARPPWETQDVPDELQIVLGREGGGAQMSVGGASGRNVSVDDAGNGMFRVSVDGQPAGTISVARDGKGDFVSAASLDEAFQGQGIGQQAYNQIEGILGRRLVPSPLGMSPNAGRFWFKRLAEMSPEERGEALFRSQQAGRAYGIPDRDINMRLYGVGGPDGLDLLESAARTRQGAP